jgi:uncharacterized protein
MNKEVKFNNLGFGLGLRPDHFQDIVGAETGVDWFEALTENYMGIPGHGQSSLLSTLLKIRKDYPIVLHCVSSNIGGTDPLDQIFLKELKALIQLVQPAWVSDHICWTGIHGLSSHELLPLPYTQETVDIVSNNIQQIQEALGMRFMIENASSYMAFEHSEMEEWEFISEIVKKTDCGLLLDINNIYVSSQNHDFLAETYIDNIPLENVGQIHLAGHRKKENGLLIDTHDQPICSEVFELLDYAYKKIPPTSVMVEWDDNIPSFDKYKAELMKAKNVIKKGLNNET